MCPFQLSKQIDGCLVFKPIILESFVEQNMIGISFFVSKIVVQFKITWKKSQFLGWF